MMNVTWRRKRPDPATQHDSLKQKKKLVILETMHGKINTCAMAIVQRG